MNVKVCYSCAECQDEIYSTTDKKFHCPVCDKEYHSQSTKTKYLSRNQVIKILIKKRRNEKINIIFKY